jgi:hypothetical protein
MSCNSKWVVLRLVEDLLATAISSRLSSRSASKYQDLVVGYNYGLPGDRVEWVSLTPEARGAAKSSSHSRDSSRTRRNQRSNSIPTRITLGEVLPGEESAFCQICTSSRRDLGVRDRGEGEESRNECDVSCHDCDKNGGGEGGGERDPAVGRKSKGAADHFLNLSRFRLEYCQSVYYREGTATGEQ